MNELADRLREARQAAGYGSAQDACEAFGWKYSTYAGHENGARGIRGDMLKRYAKAYRVTVEWLLTGEGGDTASVASADPITRIPLYDLRVSAGPGSFGEDSQPLGYQPYREQELRRLTRSKPENLSVLEVSGDSMWETLHDGDKVLVDRSVSRIVKDAIYIIAFEDELLIKRCQRDLENGDVIVRSDNPAYREFRISDADKLAIIGRVVWIGRALG
nr:helix-turn-helix transcriptional regulator [Henriciella sp.]